MPLQDSDIKEVTSRLDVIIKLMAALFAKEFSNIDAIVKLENMQLSREQIANALGITTQNVRQQLYVSKKVEKKADKKAKKSEGGPTGVEAPAEVVAAEEVQQ